MLTSNNHSVSNFSEMHFSSEKNFIDISFSAMNWGSLLFGKETFIMDHGYDENKMFLKMDFGGDWTMSSAEDVIIAENYTSSDYEFKVRKLTAINILIFYTTLYSIPYTYFPKLEMDALKVSIIKTVDSVKGKVYFCYYKKAKYRSHNIVFKRKLALVQDKTSSV